VRAARAVDLVADDQRREPVRRAELGDGAERGIRADQRAGAAVLQDVTQLAATQQRIRGHEDRAETAGRERELDDLGTVLQVDHDSVAAPDPARGESDREARAALGELGVRDRAMPMAQRLACAPARGPRIHQVVEQRGSRDARGAHGANFREPRSSVNVRRLSSP
jgi:hypothetical protein